MSGSPDIALEFVADRLAAILANRKVEISIDETDRVRKLGGRLSSAYARLIAEGYLQDRLAIELPALAQAVMDVQAHFNGVIAAAKDEVPAVAQKRIRDLESRLAASQAETVEARKERDEYARQFGDLEMLRDAALQWQKDTYNPRLQNAIGMFSRRQVSKR